MLVVCTAVSDNAVAGLVMAACAIATFLSVRWLKQLRCLPTFRLNNMFRRLDHRAVSVPRPPKLRIRVGGPRDKRIPEDNALAHWSDDGGRMRIGAGASAGLHVRHGDGA